MRPRQSRSTSVVLLVAVVVAVLGVVHSQPLWDIPYCAGNDPNWTKVPFVSNFVDATGSGSPVQQTKVHACYNSDYLMLHYDCIDNNIVSNFTQCNDPLYEQDAVEVFLAPGDDIPQKYFELEVSPNGVLFVSAIYNPYGECAGMTGSPFNCSETGIIVSATRNDAAHYWNATLMLPWSFLGIEQADWRMNFFRIDQPKNGAREFSAWSPTYANPPCFHVPQYFGYVTA